MTLSELIGVRWAACIAMMLTACGGRGSGASDDPSWRFATQGLVNRFRFDHATEAVAWRWRDFFPNDTMQPDSLWVVGVFGTADGDVEGVSVDSPGLVGKYGLVPVTTPGSQPKEPIATWDHVTTTAYGYVFPPEAVSRGEGPENRQTFYIQMGACGAGKSESNEVSMRDVDPSALTFDGQKCHTDDRHLHTRSFAPDGKAKRVWSYNFGRFDFSQPQPDAVAAGTALRHLGTGGSGVAYKLCRNTGEQLLTNAAGFTWCAPDCQLVLRDPNLPPDGISVARGQGPSTPQQHLLRDSSGALLYPACPESFSNWGAGPSGG